MDSQTYRRAGEILLAVGDLAPEERRAEVKRLCEDDPALLKTVEDFLKSDELADQRFGPMDHDTPANPPIDWSVPPTLGDYELQEEIGRGGMGVVYKAVQRSLNRTVALKIIRNAHFVDAGEIRRLQFEAELASRLDHPAIIPVYEVGQQGPYHYYSMQLVDGCFAGTMGHDTRADAQRMR